MGRNDELEDDVLDTAEDTSLRDTLSEAFDEAPAADEPDEGDADDGLDEDGQPRDERGRWTKAQREHYEAQQREQQAAQEAQDGQQQEGQGELRIAPPPGWSPAAKAAFGTLPAEVQEAVARREQEVNQGFVKLRDYKGLEEYADMARSGGTTLREAFDRYKAAEDSLDQDFAGGVMQLCEMYGVHPMQLAQHYANMFTGQPGAPRAPAMDPQTGLLARELAGMRETIRTLTTEREQQEREAINGHVQQFAQDKIYFEDVRQDMAKLIRAGLADDLDEAYYLACQKHPEIRALLIKEQGAPQANGARVSRARRASGSLQTGAPAGDVSNGGSKGNLRADLLDAWDQSAN